MAIRKSGGKLNEEAKEEVRQWCRKIGYEVLGATIARTHAEYSTNFEYIQPSDFSRLNAIHIAGTKGKGSTSAFTSSILTQFIGEPKGDGTLTPITKIGLYTSPHLRFVRERIQINNKPLSEEEFARYFFEIWDRLETSAQKAGMNPKDVSSKPAYFQYQTLMAFHTYLSKGVDCAIIECGIGGEYDSTNVLTRPTLTGITSLSIDHEGVLGGTIEQIAWHKAGIMKPGAKCLSSPGQPTAAVRVLEDRAKERGVELQIVEIDQDINSGKTVLGLDADFQKINASLAVALAKNWLEKRGIETEGVTFNEKVNKGLLEVQWGGRCETRCEPGLTWYIDGGHTLDSIEMAGKWFAYRVLSRAKMTQKKTIRALIFNQQTRDASPIVKALHTTLSTALRPLKPFSHVFFCTNTTLRETGFRPDLLSINTNASDVSDLKVQNGLARTWADIDPSTSVTVVRTIEDAVTGVRQLVADGSEVTAFVTGSLHLVGGFLEVLESKPDETQYTR